MQKDLNEKAEKERGKLCAFISQSTEGNKMKLGQASPVLLGGRDSFIRGNSCFPPVW